jgi:hypothetical protein
MSRVETTLPHVDRYQSYALMAGAAGLGLSAVAGFAFSRALFPAYLVAYLFWVGIAFGCIAFLCIHNLTGGQWGLAIRRPLEAGAMTILPMAVLFVPIVLGLRAIYPWADPEIARANPAIRHKALYLNQAAFLLRAAIYFGFWSTLAILFHNGAMRRDSSSGREVRAPWLPTLSGPGLALMFFTGNFAAIDWGMSLEPAWYSTIYGPMVMIGWGLITLSTMIVVSRWLAHASPEFRDSAAPSRIQDVGNLTLAFTMLWAYMSFSQLLIIWSGNLNEEIPWYLRRTRGGWQYVGIALVFFHFFAPFFALFASETKRRLERLIVVAWLLLGMHLVDLAWLVLPAGAARTGHDTAAIPWGSLPLVLVAFVGIGGISTWTFLWHLRRRPLVPAELLTLPAPAQAYEG